MRKSRYVWRLIAFTSVLSSILFITGFGYAIKSILFPPPTNLTSSPDIIVEPSPIDNDYTLLGLGDSITRGTGDPSSKGYIGHVFEKLKEESDPNRSVKLINFAIDGYTTEELLDDLHHRPGVIAAIQSADMILLTIGANDMFSVGEEVDIAAANLISQQSIERIDQILTRLTELNSSGSIYFIGLYNPFIEMEQGEEISLFVQNWNFEIFKRVNRLPQVTLIPTFDLFVKKPLESLSSDHYHPSESSYKQIAERVIQTVNNS